MTPKRIDVSIICSVCNKPVEKREMIHDAPGGTYKYLVSCHGAKDFGDHLIVVADDTAHGKVLSAFPSAPATVPSIGGTNVNLQKPPTV